MSQFIDTDNDVMSVTEVDVGGVGTIWLRVITMLGNKNDSETMAY